MENIHLQCLRFTRWVFALYTYVLAPTFAAMHWVLLKSSQPDSSASFVNRCVPCCDQLCTWMETNTGYEHCREEGCIRIERFPKFEGHAPQQGLDLLSKGSCVQLMFAFLWPAVHMTVNQYSITPCLFSIRRICLGFTLIAHSREELQDFSLGDRPIYLHRYICHICDILQLWL